MTTDRSYRSALPLEAAIAELRANAGSQFDPAVVEA
jgi:HD-GYP domain-containing protein (c-di-GMP phosphodiesterase class II)